MKVKVIKTPSVLLRDGGNIHIKKSHEGLFTDKAKRAGMGVLEYASYVLNHKDKFSPATVKQANFAKNATKFQHAFGGNLFEEGGNVLGGYHTNGMDWEAPGNFNVINTGGTHEENLNQGVLLGVDNEGTPNFVEEGEVVYNDYVFSARLKVPKRRKGKEKEISDLSWEEKMLKPYEGMTYADAALKAYKNAKERPMDSTEKRGLEVILGILAGSLEKERAKAEHQEASELIENTSGKDFMAMQEAERMAMEIAQQQDAQLALQLMLQLPLELVELPQQELSPEEQLALLQQQGMQQMQVASLGGNLHAFGGNFFSDGGKINLQEYQLIFELIVQLTQQGIQENLNNPEVLEQLLAVQQAIALVKTNQDLVNFVEQYLAMVSQQNQPLLPMQEQAPQQVLELIPELAEEIPQQNRFALGGNLFKGGSKMLKFNGSTFKVALDKNNIPSIEYTLDPSEQDENNFYEFLQYIENNGLTPQDLYDYSETYVKSLFPEDAVVSTLTDREKKKLLNSIQSYYSDRTGVRKNKFTNDINTLIEEDYKAALAGLELDNKYNFKNDSELHINNEALKNKKTNLNALRGIAFRKSFGDNATLVTPVNNKIILAELPGLKRVSNVDYNTLTNEEDALKKGIDNILIGDGNTILGGDRYKYIYTDDSGKSLEMFVHKPSDGFNISKTPTTFTTDNGIVYNDYMVSPNVISTNYVKNPYNNELYEVTGTLPDYLRIDTKNNIGIDDSGLGFGVKSSPKFYTYKEETSTTPFPEIPTYPFYAAGALQGLAAIHNAVTPIDRTESLAIVNAAKDAGQLPKVEFNPIGNYMTPTIYDTLLDITNILNKGAATDRALQDLSGGNRASASAGIINNAYNNINLMGDAARKAYLIGRDLEAKRLAYNNSIDQFNSEGRLKQSLAAQEAAMKTNAQYVNAVAKAAVLDQLAKTYKNNAFNSNLSGLANIVMNYANNEYNRDLLNWKKDHNYAPLSSNGGKLRKKKRGLSI